MIDIIRFMKGILIQKEDTLTPSEIAITPGGEPDTRTTITTVQTGNQTITLPDATDTLVGKQTVDNFINKTIDLDGNGNMIYNIRDANLAGDAAINAQKISSGLVSNGEFDQLFGVTSNIQSQLDAKASSADLTNHITNPTGAHAASAIAVTPSGNLTSTNAQAALVELQTDVDTRIPLAQKGANNGVATLDAGGKIPAAQLPSSVIEYKGTWDAATNTPALTNGDPAADAGDVYIVNVAGTHDFGAGPITFGVGDWVIYSGTIWQKSSNSSDVVSVNGKQGVVVLNTDDIAEGVINLYWTSARAATKANTSLNNITATAASADINPGLDEAYNLGNVGTKWNQLHTALVIAYSANRAAIYRPTGTGFATTLASSVTVGTNSFDITNVSGINTNWEIVAPLIFPRGTFITSIAGNTVTTSNNAMITAGSGSAVFLAPQLNMRSENVTGTDHSGSTWVRSGSSVTGTTGNVNVRSGNSSNGGQTGDVTLAAGTTVGTRGRAIIDGKFVNIGAPAATDPSGAVIRDVYYNTTTNKYRYYNGTAFVDLGSGSATGSGRVNYITNPDAETDTVGWTTYQNTAQPTPVTGTGGTPTAITFSRSITTPLFGTGSFLFTKSATNGQGQGVSTPFTISSVDQGKDLEISMRFAVNSGTYAAGDVTAYIYDITNATLITPSLTQLDPANNSFFSTFKAASNSVDYRLILHISSTSALAYELKLDLFEVGPQLVTSQQVYTTDVDTAFKIDGSLGVGSVGTKVLRFNSSNIRQNIGSGATYISDAVNGDRIVIQTAGTWTFNLNMQGTGLATVTTAISRNASSLTTNPESLPQSEILDIARAEGGGTTRPGEKVSWTGNLNVGDVIRFLASEAPGGLTTITTASWARQGGVKTISAVSNQSLAIPYSEGRMEGAAARGSTDTTIVRFDALTSIVGDAVLVSNTAANGTVLTITKPGNLSINATLSAGTQGTFTISRNQANLNAQAALSEVLASGTWSASGPMDAGWSGTVKLGDIIRVSANNTPSNASAFNLLSWKHEDANLQVGINTVQPQWSQTDSSVELKTGNGFGSVGTTVRRFSNIVNNIGSDITYTDSATAGGSFTINSDGTYAMAFTDTSGTGTPAIGITKNQANLTSIANSEYLSNINTAGTGASTTASATAYLLKGDVIRFVSPGPGSISSASAVTNAQITKVGKPNIAAVNVTPFVDVNEQDVESIRLNTGNGFGSTNTVIRRFATTAQNTNKGILKYEDSATLGASFTALKPCTATIAYQDQTGAGSSEIGLSYNLSGTITTGINSIAAANKLVQNSSSNGSISNMKTTVVATITLATGDVIRPHVDTPASVTSGGIANLTVTAIATNPAIVSTSSQVSSDTMAFSFKATAIDPQTDAVGTFNTYTYATNTNTATIASTAPTQTLANMNANGVQVFSRPYNSASTAAQPSRVDIFIGRGLAQHETSWYGGLGKTISLLKGYYNVSGTYTNGAKITYNEVTGILTIDAASCSTSTTSRNFAAVGDDVGYTSAYITFTASANPALISVPTMQKRIAVLRDEKSSGTAGGTSVTAYTDRILNTINDPTGIILNASSFLGVNGTTTQFQLGPGTYKIAASMPYFHGGNGVSGKSRLQNITDGTTALNGTPGQFPINCVGYSFINGTITINNTKTFAVQGRVGSAATTNGWGQAFSGGDNEVYTMIEIEKIN